MTLPAGVDAVLDRLHREAAAILGQNFVGLYLYGSLATGGFTPETSDVDFIVVLRSALSPEEGVALEELHRRLQVDCGKWAAKLEGAYVPLVDLRRHIPDAGPFLAINEGKIYWASLGTDWVIQRHTLLAHPVSVVGPSLAGLIDPVSADDLQAAVRGNFGEWWLPMLGEVTLLERHDYRQYAVLTMCRILRLFQAGEMASKPAAAEWALTTQDGRWHPLIRWAQAWTPGAPAAPVDDVKALIRSVAGVVG